MKSVSVELTPAPGLDLNSEPEQAEGALVSSNVRRDSKGLKPCQPMKTIATDGTANILGLHFHAQRDSSFMRVSASDKLYLDGVAAKSVVTGSDFTF